MEDCEEIDPRRSLLELEEADWDPTRYDDAAQRLVAKPVRKLAAGELLHLIQQGCARRFTIPLALERLAADPLLAAAAHPGDLLVAVLEAPAGFWTARPALWAQTAALVGEVAGRAQAAAEGAERAGYLPDVLGDDLMAAVLHFRGVFPAEAGEEFTD
jgi:hypothetical protein